MSGRARLTLAAWGATLMAAGALLPLVKPATWIFTAAFVLALVSGVGTLARRVPLARPLTLLAQAVVVLLALTLFFAREQAILWLIPGPQALAYTSELFRAGVEDVGRYAIPAPDTAGIRLMLVGGVVAIGLLVDALAVTFRRAAPAGLPLLALYSVAAGLSGGGAGWLWFLLAASGYLLLLLAEGRDRLSQWGRVFGGAQRSGRPGSSVASGGPAFAPVRTGRRIGVVAMGVAMVVPLALPGLSGGLFGGSGGAGVPGAARAAPSRPSTRWSRSRRICASRRIGRSCATGPTPATPAACTCGSSPSTSSTAPRGSPRSARSRTCPSSCRGPRGSPRASGSPR